MFGSSAGVGTGHCIGNSANMTGAGSQAACPSTAEGDYVFTEGPVPAGGGTISNLQAETDTAPATGKSWVVNVIDETAAGAQTTVMTCTVAAGTTTCGAGSPSSVSIAAGHYLMVELTTSNGAAAKTWRVTFRY